MSLERARDLIESEPTPLYFQVAPVTQPAMTRADGVSPQPELGGTGGTSRATNPAFVPPVLLGGTLAARSNPASLLTVPPVPLVPPENKEGEARTWQDASSLPLFDALEIACKNLPITPVVVLSAVATEDKAASCRRIPGEPSLGRSCSYGTEIWRRAD